MKDIPIVMIAAVVLAGCSGGPQAAAPAPKPAAPEPLKATRWTDNGELYLEYPPLIANHQDRFAIHLTRLSDFRAVKDATCEVQLTRGAVSEIFPCETSTQPGIFGANVQPKNAGEAQLAIFVRGKDLSETFRVGSVRIAADRASAEQPVESKQETISFSKEQQWALDFGTQLASEQTLRDSLRVGAEVLPRTGGEVNVIAPVAGRLIVERTFAVGSTIEKGSQVASIVPPTGAVSDLAALQLAESEAKIALEQARRDRARADRLLAAGAVPTRRAEEARTAEATAEARLQAAQTRLAQYDSGAGVAAGAKRFVVKAPIGGIVSQSNAVSGANVGVGSVLLQIVDTDTLYVSGAVPETEIGKIRQISGAEIESSDAPEPRPAGRLVSVGRLVDPATRTTPVVYQVENRDHRLAIHQTVFLRLLLTPSAKASVVPEAAVIDDAGRPVVFAQVAGESFVRRPVKLGVHNSGMVQVLEGIQPGDRVVTKGAYLIRLSTMSSAVPAHGHVH